MFLSGVQSGFRLDSRLKHAGITDFGWGIYLTQQAAGNRPTEIEALSNEVMRHRLTSCREWKNCWAEKLNSRPALKVVAWRQP
jgi:hypothetical protein